MGRASLSQREGKSDHFAVSASSAVPCVQDRPRPVLAENSIRPVSETLPPRQAIRIAEENGVWYHPAVTRRFV